MASEDASGSSSLPKGLVSTDEEVHATERPLSVPDDHHRPAGPLSESDIEAIAELMLAKFREKGPGATKGPPEGVDTSDGSDKVPRVRVLPPTGSVEGTDTSRALVTLTDLMKDMPSIGNPPVEKEKAKDSLVFICEGIPPLPSKVIQGIEKGEFIELANLLPKNASWEEDPYMEVSEKVIVLTHGKPAPKKRTIENIETWMEAFCTYVAVRGKKHPGDIAELMAYAMTIVKGARDYGGRHWLTYDYRFRQLAAAKRMEKGWGQKDMALWNDTFLKPKSQANDKGEQPSDRTGVGHKRGSETSHSTSNKKPKKSTPHWKSQICYPFSYAGKCPREKCDYRHICYDCGGDHSQSSCPKKSS